MIWKVVTVKDPARLEAQLTALTAAHFTVLTLVPAPGAGYLIVAYSVGTT